MRCHWTRHHTACERGIKPTCTHSFADAQVPIDLDPDFVTECNNMCNAFCYFLRQTEVRRRVFYGPL